MAMECTKCNITFRGRDSVEKANIHKDQTGHEVKSK